MNFNKFINSDYLKSNPLCGISTYKDELNLATGACTRQIKKLVFDGTEWWYNNSNNACCVLELSLIGVFTEYNPLVRCSHVPMATTQEELFIRQVDYGITFGARGADRICIRNKDCESVDDFKAWLAAEYANGTPVTVWYVLETPTTETITVPSGLSGTEEGYLNQSGTPTPTNPIYPTANTVEKWFDIPHYIHNTSTDTITTLPADIYANDTTATVGLKGNMVQSGTPSPTTPIQPSECGERTGNLVDISTYTASGGQSSKYEYFKNVTLSAGTYTFSCRQNNTLSSAIRNTLFVAIDANLTYESTVADYHLNAGIHSLTFTLESNKTIILGCWTNTLSNDCVYDEFMLNTGSTALPYEPYGQYKIPILNNSQTTNVYLGEVETTRKIKKLVFDGSEPWAAHATQPNLYTLNNVSDYLHAVNPLPICSHYPTRIVASAGAVGNNELALYYNQGQPSVSVLYIKNTEIASADDFKTYLQQQYANGTPVTVWYVLATEETGIVNEPIRKIGTYADEVSGITIPTIAGTNTLSIGTTLQPSEVTVNYKGWHPVADVHERESGQWD